MSTEAVVQETAKEALPLIQQYAQEVLLWVKSSATFIVDQMPQLVQEVLRWGIASNAFGIGLGFIIVLAGVCANSYFLKNRPYFKEWNKDHDEMCVTQIFSAVVSAVGYLLGTLLILINTFSLLKVLVAPRLYLLEQLATLAKGQ